MREQQFREMVFDAFGADYERSPELRCLVEALRLKILPRDRLPASITCPECARTSHHPRDVEEGYCANCRNWTSSWWYQEAKQLKAAKDHREGPP
jgi:hypothetical protein